MSRCSKITLVKEADASQWLRVNTILAFCWGPRIIYYAYLVGLGGCSVDIELWRREMSVPTTGQLRNLTLREIGKG